MFTKQLLASTRGGIVSLLQREPGTVDEIASQLRLTANAVRAQITSMERDGIVRRSGRRAGVTRPSHLFELTPETEQLLSHAYIPLLAQLIKVFADGLPATEIKRLFRQAGRGLADELFAARRPSGTLRARVNLASRLMNEQLGAITHVEANGSYVIRGAGCPLAALTGKHPAVCLAMESMLAALLETPVRECCERSGRPRCCFEVKGGSSRGGEAER
jgi:DeoR family suf operon transcriptional repressor